MSEDKNNEPSLTPKQSFILQLVRINAWLVALAAFAWLVFGFMESQEQRHHELLEQITKCETDK